MSTRPLYNPALLSKQELIDGFVVREAELRELESLVRGATEDTAPQHALVLGWRGMGKTTLLHRLAYLVTDDPDLSSRWLPVLFDEEQYNIGDLADFWLDALRMVSVATGDPTYERQADQLPREHDTEALEEATRRALHDASMRLQRRLLLLVDSFDDVLERIDDDLQQSRLRAVLQHEPWAMLVAASSSAIEATYHYDRPLYDQLAVIELSPLNDDQTLHLLDEWAHRDGAEELAARVHAQQERLRKLHLLIGGNPRTAALLYGMWREGGRGELRTQLEALLDQHTSLYKARVEELAKQTQRVFDALAQRWEAATAEELAHELRLKRGPVSAQLTRLLDRGLVERVDIGQRAVAYQVRERLFNLWCLMRGSRRGGQRVRWLAEWIELFYPRHDQPLLVADSDEPALLAAASEAYARRSPAEIAVLEARLGRSGPAVEALAEALELAPDEQALDLCLGVAPLAPAGVLDALERAGRADRFLPLADALRIHLGQPEGLHARLPIERRVLAEDVSSYLGLSQT